VLAVFGGLAAVGETLYLLWLALRRASGSAPRGS
jgi:hypothetical protein